MNKLVMGLILGAMVLIVWNPDISSLSALVPSVVSPDDRVPTPTAAMQAKVAHITDLVSAGEDHKVDGQLMGNFFRDLAAYGAADTNIKTKHQMRQLTIEAGRAEFEGRFKGKYKDLGKAINKFVDNELTLSPGPLDEATRIKAVKAWEAVSWACYQGS